MQYDTLIRNAVVIDGSNTPGYRADVAILNGRIERIGDLPDARATEAIDAAVNSPIPNTNILRRPHRSPSVVAESISVAKQSVYAFMNH